MMPERERAWHLGEWSSVLWRAPHAQSAGQGSPTLLMNLCQPPRCLVCSLSGIMSERRIRQLCGMYPKGRSVLPWKRCTFTNCQLRTAESNDQLVCIGVKAGRKTTPRWVTCSLEERLMCVFSSSSESLTELLAIRYLSQSITDTTTTRTQCPCTEHRITTSLFK